MANSIERWVEKTVREHSRAALIHAGTQFVLALAGLGLWFGVSWGLMFMFSIVLSALGVGLNGYMLITLGLWAVQCGLYLVVRQRGNPAWEVSTDVDGNVLVSAPEHAAESGELSHRGMLASIFFCVPVAIEDAMRAFRRALHIRRTHAEPLTRLTAELFEVQRKVSFEDLSQQMSSQTLKTAVSDATWLPGFQMFANEPQGISLTGTAIEELGAA
jgi:hypothetical protein